MKKNYLCFCNQCNNAFIDINPGPESIEYMGPSEMTFNNLLSLERIECQESETTETFIGCPICKDDGFLVDNIPSPIAEKLGIKKVN